ncbi:hypothetical protein DL95DRAFT_503038 [Leptodontidium sp. 2 PMI_412]|nr:hypothetical protein DL95DRAFT_503038 [Leptodontidium sp. 2 PMI_412]
MGQTAFSLCGAKTSEISVTYQLGGSADFNRRSSTSTLPNTEDVASAAHMLGMFMESGAQCGASILSAKPGSVVVGLYSGAEVTKKGAKDFLESFVESPGSSASQVCSPANAELTIGTFAAALEDLSAVHGVVRGWTNGLCLNGSTALASATRKMEVLVSKIQDTNSTTNLDLDSPTAARSLSRPRALTLGARADCRAIEVISGDSCASIASRCGVSANDFTKYNPSSTLCSTLQLKQHVCYSASALPTCTPKPQSDSTCTVYKVAAGDGCWAIADTHYLQTTDFDLGAAARGIYTKNNMRFHILLLGPFSR